MRYYDIQYNNITHSVKANDLRFKTYISDIINVSGVNNLKDSHTLTEALNVLDDLKIGVNDASLDSVVKNINDNTLLYEGTSAKQHLFIHNLNTEFLNYSVWVLESIGWQNSIVPVTIIDQDQVLVELAQPKSCRIILNSITDISKTYAI